MVSDGLNRGRGVCSSVSTDLTKTMVIMVMFPYCWHERTLGAVARVMEVRAVNSELLKNIQQHKYGYNYEGLKMFV